MYIVKIEIDYIFIYNVLIKNYRALDADWTAELIRLYIKFIPASELFQTNVACIKKYMSRFSLMK